jgi:predicted ATPase
MPELPGGTVTFVFTDIEGSTRLLRELGEGYADALAEHRRVVREAFAEGVEVDTQGDAFFYAFADARAAAAAAAAAQRALDAGPVRVRMGLHTGVPERTGDGYVGLDVHLGARIASSGHGGQVLLSNATAGLLTAPSKNLGTHRLKDFDDPVEIFQLGDEAFPPLKTIANTNLPRPASSFVGREREIGEVVAAVRNATRLLTLTGPGGSGKTRLAIEAASELVGDFGGGVFWVGLAALRDPALVLPTVAEAVGADGSLAAHIGKRDQLLLLDNLEQVIAAAPEVIEVVEACPNLRLMVTSRELLRVRGEVEYEVLPLANAEAVALFCERAGVTPSPAVEELCRRLDDMPLALELAAARVKVLAPEQIVERLGQRLDLLRGGRDAEPRQATLRATIEWSHDLLDAEEQELFARLSVFPRCTFEAAEAVCDADLDVLQSLVEKSLVRRTDDRFWMLETIREFAGERLDASGEADAIRRRQAEHAVRLAETTNLRTERTESGPNRYDIALPERDNFRAALDWALDHDPALGVLLMVELEQFWVSYDPGEGARRLGALLDAAGELPPDLEAAGLRVLGGTTQVAGDPERGAEFYGRSLELYEHLGDEWGIVHLRHRVWTTQAVTEQQAWLEENLARARRLGSRMLEIEAISGLAWLAQAGGDFERAAELYRVELQGAREVGFAWFVQMAAANLAECELELGRLDDAEMHAAEALGVSREIEDERMTAWVLLVLAGVAARRGQAGHAGRLAGAAEAKRQRDGLGWGEDEYAQWVARLPTGDLGFEAGRQAGLRLPLDEAAAEVLAQRDAT